MSEREIKAQFARICREAPTMRREGDSAKVIAARLSVSVHTVYRALRRTGNGRWRWDHARICREAAAMRRMGDSVTLIASRLRVCVDTVYRALRRTGNGRWRWGGN